MEEDINLFRHTLKIPYIRCIGTVISRDLALTGMALVKLHPSYM